MASIDLSRSVFLRSAVSVCLPGEGEKRREATRSRGAMEKKKGEEAPTKCKCGGAAACAAGGFIAASVGGGWCVSSLVSYPVVVVVVIVDSLCDC